jgi:putative transposase
MNTANEYMDRGVRISDIANMIHIPECNFYRNNSGERSTSGRVRSNSFLTLMKNGNETIVVDTSIIVNEMEDLLSREFVCYVYKKIAKHLNKLGYKINRKMVRRLMAENNLLNHSYNKRKPVTRFIKSVVDVTANDQVWEFDIKYVWIHGESRNAYLLSMIDCYSREAVGHCI